MSSCLTLGYTNFLCKFCLKPNVVKSIQLDLQKVREGGATLSLIKTGGVAYNKEEEEEEEEDWLEN